MQPFSLQFGTVQTCTHEQQVYQGPGVWVHFLRIFHVPFEDLLESEVIGGSSERRFANEELVQHTPKSPDIRAVHRKSACEAAI